MMRPSRQIVRTYAIPPDVIAAAYTQNPHHRERTLEALRKVRELCRQLGLVTPLSAPIWQWLGIWDASAAAA
jgi:hypothetical protein